MAVVPAAASAISLPPGFEDRPLARGLDAPIAVDWAPDGRMFVAEHAGRVRVVSAAGQLEERPLLDITDHTNVVIDQGILGLAVDSDFEENHHLWVLYVREGNRSDAYGAKTARLVRVTVNADNTLESPESPETVVLGKVDTTPCPEPSNVSDCIPSSWSHTVGTVRSAPDGTLWVGAGDAGVPFRAFDEQSYSGKIMHVDRQGRGLPGHPFCPADDDLGHVCTKIHAKGFRNPFRFTLRPGGGLVVGDVGDETRDELDLVTAGLDYGWPCYEGGIRSPRHGGDARCSGPGGAYSREGTAQAAVPPPYDHSVPPEGAAIIGGPTYTADAYPLEYRGDVFFADYAKRFVKHAEVGADDRITAVSGFATDWPGVDLELAPWGDLVYADIVGGDVRAISYSPSNATPVARASADPTFGDLPLEVRFRGSTSSDLDGDPLRYEWDLGDGTTSTEADPVHTYPADGKYVAKLTVSDGRGRNATDTVVISAGNSPPTAHIAAPLDESSFRDGDSVQLSGSATDPHDGVLADSALRWNIVLHHGGHVHPFGPFAGGTASFVAADDHDADSYYEVRFTATNSRGLADTAVVNVTPRTAQLKLESNPSGAPLTYSGTSVTAPYTHDAAVGFRTSVSARDRLFLEDGKVFRFVLWTDLGDRSHQITIPAGPKRLTAVYGEDKAADRAASATTHNTGFEPYRAVDGLPETRWKSAPVGADVWPQHWQVDLGSVRPVNTVWLEWADAYAAEYAVSTSTDGTSFTQAATGTATGAGLRSLAFGSRQVRYLRVTSRRNGTANGISLSEVTVFGAGDAAATENKAAGRPASASSSRSDGPAASAVDGSTTTRWRSLAYGPMWWQVDLGRNRSIDRVALDWDGLAWPSNYEISTSTDGTSFSMAANVLDGVPGWRTHSIAPRTARYVRVTSTRAATFDGIALWEARVFGRAD